jgi:hypothetical protein
MSCRAYTRGGCMVCFAYAGDDDVPTRTLTCWLSHRVFMLHRLLADILFGQHISWTLLVGKRLLIALCADGKASATPCSFRRNRGVVGASEDVATKALTS